MLAAAAADDQYLDARARHQCRKWRMPVNSMASPCSLAAAMTSASRMRSAGLDHRGHALVGGHIHAIAERKEGVRGHDRAAHGEAGILGLDGADAAGIDAAHLAGAHADGGLVARKDDGVGLHELADAPGEGQVAQFLGSGLRVRDAFQRVDVDARRHRDPGPARRRRRCAVRAPQAVRAAAFR